MEIPAGLETKLALSPWKSTWVRLGAIMLVVASVQFFLAMAVEERLRPGYSDSVNTISDLGVNGQWVGGIYYDWHYDWIFNTSIIVLGLMAITAIFLLYRIFPRGIVAYLGEAFIIVGSGGAIGVGIFTESYPFSAYGLTAHDYASVITFLFANVGMTVLGLAMYRHKVWGTYWLFTFLLGLGSTIALSFYIYYNVTTKWFFGLGEGGLERIVAFPVLIWAIVVGLASYSHWRDAARGPGAPARAMEQGEVPS